MLSNAESVRHFRLKAFGALGALTLGSCLVYSPDDLIGATAGSGGRITGGAGGASGAGGDEGGTGFGGFAGRTGGSSGSGPGGEGGAGGAGGDGEEGGSPSGGSATGGAAGTPSSGGSGGGAGGLSGGSSGAPTGGTGVGGGITNPELIDDMEDGNQFIKNYEKRTGLWYTAADTANGASAVPPPDAFVMAELPAEKGTAPGSTWAFHFVGKGGTATAWGALASIDLMNPVGMTKTPYDASKYKGLHFWAKAVGAAATVRVRLVLKGTLAEAGGKCGTGCNNHPYLSQSLTTAWREYVLRWDQADPEQIPFRQEPWGTQVAFNPAELVEIQFVVPPTSKTADFWLDDISFIP